MDWHAAYYQYNYGLTGSLNQILPDGLVVKVGKPDMLYVATTNAGPVTRSEMQKKVSGQEILSFPAPEEWLVAEECRVLPPVMPAFADYNTDDKDDDPRKGCKDRWQRE